jgi:hypothetical protein
LCHNDLGGYLSFVNYYIGWVFAISVSASSSSSQPIDELELLDWGARIGVAASRRRDVDRDEETAKSQLENLIASLDSVSGREALLATAAYALRQARRNRIDHLAANLIRQALIDLYEKGANKDHARKMLDFAKWIYEAKIDYQGRIEQLTLLQLLKQYSQQRQRRTR